MERGQRIRELIEKTGVRQTWLAERLGVSPEAVGNWISGRTGISPENRERLAEALGVDGAYIEFGSKVSDPRHTPSPTPDADRAILDSEPVLLLGTIGPELSREALKEIARFIRFIHKEETKGGRE